MGKYGHAKYVYFVDEILVQPGYLICIAHLWWKIGSIHSDNPLSQWSDNSQYTNN